MRHSKHKHTLGVTKEHRAAMMASLSTALFRHDRIETTLANAKAMRPFVERVITLAKKAAATEDKAQKLHFRRLAISRVRDAAVVAVLFDQKVEKFLNRAGGYTRIYKLVPRRGDAANMALIEMIEADDEGYKKVAKKAAKKTAKKAAKKTATKKAAAKKAAPKAEEPAAAEAPAAENAAESE